MLDISLKISCPHWKYKFHCTCKIISFFNRFIFWIMYIFLQFSLLCWTFTHMVFTKDHMLLHLSFDFVLFTLSQFVSFSISLLQNIVIWSFSLRIIKEIEIIAFQVFILFWFLLPLSDPSFICFFKFFCSDLSRILRPSPYVQRSSVSISFFFHFSPYLYPPLTPNSSLLLLVSSNSGKTYLFFLVLSTLQQIYSAFSQVATLILCHGCQLH